MEQSVQRQTNEPPIQDITQEIMNPLHEKATRIQRMARAVRQRRNNTDRQYKEQISREFDENITGSNLTVNGYITSGNNVWNRSADGIYRTYYATNEISYYCCGGNSAIGHVFIIMVILMFFK